MTILVIEDDPRIYELYRSHLEAEGHEVEVAADYNTAVSRRHQVENYDLIISDVDLGTGDFNGPAAVSELTKAGYDKLGAFCSGNINPGDAEEWKARWRAAVFDKSDLLGLFSHVDALAAHFYTTGTPQRQLQRNTTPLRPEGR